MRAPQYGPATKKAEQSARSQRLRAVRGTGAVPVDIGPKAGATVIVGALAGTTGRWQLERRDVGLVHEALASVLERGFAREGGA